MVTQNKTINRLLSLVLCLCMVLTLLPMLPMEAEAATPQYLYLVPNSNGRRPMHALRPISLTTAPVRTHGLV